ncbi:activator of s-phase kinase-related [Anaeramoeba flamelloides]|uniref:Activator of s-phase kinase-related n=1 Tax=Anaeramoeba flamelloides TaxID=1746091 RepID=A0AAV7ZWK9_9EUKA|nr:activator of s-phase kinase-related [Anaeramoeba flamelloides]
MSQFLVGKRFYLDLLNQKLKSDTQQKLCEFGAINCIELNKNVNYLITEQSRMKNLSKDQNSILSKARRMGINILLISQVRLWLSRKRKGTSPSNLLTNYIQSKEISTKHKTQQNKKTKASLWNQKIKKKKQKIQKTKIKTKPKKQQKSPLPKTTQPKKESKTIVKKSFSIQKSENYCFHSKNQLKIQLSSSKNSKSLKTINKKANVLNQRTSSPFLDNSTPFLIIVDRCRDFKPIAKEFNKGSFVTTDSFLKKKSQKRKTKQNFTKLNQKNEYFQTKSRQSKIDLKKYLLKKRKSNMRIKKKRKETGYCGNCMQYYKNYDLHILSEKHRKFAITSNKFSEIDQFLQNNFLINPFPQKEKEKEKTKNQRIQISTKKILITNNNTINNKNKNKNNTNNNNSKIASTAITTPTPTPTMSTNCFENSSNIQNQSIENTPFSTLPIFSELREEKANSLINNFNYNENLDRKRKFPANNWKFSNRDSLGSQQNNFFSIINNTAKKNRSDSFIPEKI